MSCRRGHTWKVQQHVISYAVFQSEKSSFVGNGVVCISSFEGKVGLEVLQTGEGNLPEMLVKYLWR